MRIASALSHRPAGPSARASFSIATLTQWATRAADAHDYDRARTLGEKADATCADRDARRTLAALRGGFDAIQARTLGGEPPRGGGLPLRLELGEFLSTAPSWLWLEAELENVHFASFLRGS